MQMHTTIHILAIEASKSDNIVKLKQTRHFVFTSVKTKTPTWLACRKFMFVMSLLRKNSLLHCCKFTKYFARAAF